MRRDARSRTAVFGVALLAVAFAIATTGAAADAPAGSDLPFETHRLRERVVVVRCGSNNVGAIATAAGLIVVDTHRSPSVMRVLAAALAEELGRDDVRFVVNTHGHWDHSSGNQVFAGATLIGHERCRETLAASRLGFPRSRWRHERYASRLARELAEAEQGDDPTLAERRRVSLEIERVVVADLDGVYVPTPPTETFTDRRELDGGNLTVRLLFCGEAHTDHDVFAWLPEEKILFTGDVFRSAEAFGFKPSALTDLPRLISVLDEILADGPAGIVVVPGHGDFLTGEDLVALRQLVAERLGEIRPDDSAASFLADRGEGGEGGGLATALAELENVLRDQPDRLDVDPEELGLLGRRWLGRGRLDDARRLLEWAVARAPDSALLWSLVAEARWRDGDLPAAEQAYLRTLESVPQHRGAAEGLEWLRLSGD